jgi:hypothetical protein
MPISQTMLEQTDDHRRRTERAAFETDRMLVIGDVTLPPEGYQSRFSDSLNRPDFSFIPVVDVEIWPIDGAGEVVRRPFIVVGKQHVRFAFPIEEVGVIQQPPPAP